MANLTLSVRFDYEYGAVATNMTLGEPYQECFRPIDHCNDTFGVLLGHENAILRGEL